MPVSIEIPPLPPHPALDAWRANISRIVSLCDDIHLMSACRRRAGEIRRAISIGSGLDTTDQRLLFASMSKSGLSLSDLVEILAWLDLVMAGLERARSPEVA